MSSTYKIYLNDREYSSWEIFDNINFCKCECNINPISEKLFSNDVFKINDDNTI